MSATEQALASAPGGVLELSRDECLALLSPGGTGRLVYTRRALPAVLTVDFLLDGPGVLVRAPGGAGAGSGTDGMVVAFQADAVEPGGRDAWTVTVVGRGRVERAPRPGRSPRSTWAAGEPGDLVLVEAGIVTGHRVLRSSPVKDSGPQGPGDQGTGPWARAAELGR